MTDKTDDLCARLNLASQFDDDIFAQAATRLREQEAEIAGLNRSISRTMELEKEWMARALAVESALAKAREAIMTVVSAVRQYLPPDGISKDDFINLVIGAVDNPTINPFIAEIENGRS